MAGSHEPAHVGSGFEQEAHLGEMVVGGQNLAQPEFAHHNETGAIGERKVLVVVTKEKAAGFFGPSGRDGFPANTRAAVDLPPPRFGGRVAEPEADEGEGLVGDVVGGDKKAALFKPGVAGFGGHAMSRVCGIGTRHPTGRVDKQGFHLA